MSERPLTILFMPESAYGPTNNCIGIGDVLRRRGHRVVFAAEASWKGRLERLGFVEDLVDLAPPSADAAGQDAGQFWKDFIRDTAPEFRKPTIEQLDTWVRPVWEELISGARYCQPQLSQILDRTRPDVIVEDNVVGFPALVTAGVPFVRIVSCNPLEIKDSQIPPTFSGYPAADPGGWQDLEADLLAVVIAIPLLLGRSRLWRGERPQEVNDAGLLTGLSRPDLPGCCSPRAGCCRRSRYCWSWRRGRMCRSWCPCSATRSR